MTASIDERPVADDQAPRRPIYDLRNVDVHLPTDDGLREVLRNITLDVREGELIGIVGRSGTGKTTLLRILGGLTSPTKGQVMFEGQPLSAPPSTVVTVFQDYQNALLPWRTVKKNVEFGIEERSSRSERSAIANEALAMVGLQGYADEYPWRLSGGMQQRVQIARALALTPRVLLMDEPFGALDAMTKSALQDQILELQERIGATIVFITHDLEEAIYLADRVFVIAGAPGQLTESINTALPRPRDQIITRELPRYLEVRHRLGQALRAEHGI